MHTKVFSVSGLPLKLVPLVNAYLLLGLGIPAAHLPLLHVRPSTMHLLRLVHYCSRFAGREVKHLGRLCW